jgi:hypothetical protein
VNIGREWTETWADAWRRDAAPLFPQSKNGHG